MFPLLSGAIGTLFVVYADPWLVVAKSTSPRQVLTRSFIDFSNMRSVLSAQQQSQYILLLFLKFYINVTQ
jgi:hypothetical protein